MADSKFYQVLFFLSNLAKLLKIVEIETFCFLFHKDVRFTAKCSPHPLSKNLLCNIWRPLQKNTSYSKYRVVELSPSWYIYNIFLAFEALGSYWKKGQKYCKNQRIREFVVILFFLGLVIKYPHIVSPTGLPK